MRTHPLWVVMRVVTTVVTGSLRVVSASFKGRYRAVIAPTHYLWVVMRVVTGSLGHTPFVVYKIKRRKGWGA